MFSTLWVDNDFLQKIKKKSVGFTVVLTLLAAVATGPIMENVSKSISMTEEVQEILLTRMPRQKMNSRNTEGD